MKRGKTGGERMQNVPIFHVNIYSGFSLNFTVTEGSLINSYIDTSRMHVRRQQRASAEVLL